MTNRKGKHLKEIFILQTMPWSLYLEDKVGTRNGIFQGLKLVLIPIALSSSSCPLCVCIDVHVTRIYNALSPVLSHFVENDISKSRAIEVLKMLRGIMVDLKKLPYKTRRVSLNSVPNNGRKILYVLVPSLGQLLRTLSLKSELKIDGQIDVVLAGDLVKTSLSLPVVLKTLEDMIPNLNNCNNFGKDSFRCHF